MAAPVFEIDITLERDCFDLKVKETFTPEGILAVMGPSGCGKTSLLRVLAGLEPGSQGCIYFNGTPWLDSSAGMNVLPEKRQVGYIFQEARLFPHLDVMGNLTYARKRATRSKKIPALSDVIQQLSIEHLLSKPVVTLSGGEKQRVAIARTILNAPSVLLMDEPLASLDWAAKVEIFPLLRNIQQHFAIPVIMVSHSPEEVAKIADQVLVMSQGRVQQINDCQSVLMQYQMHAMTAVSHDHAFSLLEGQVARQDEINGLTEIKIDNQMLVVKCVPLTPGSAARVLIPAIDVSLFLEDITATSVQNRLRVVVKACQPVSKHQVLVSLTLGKQILLSMITVKGLSALSLKKGQVVFAHVKATSLSVN